MASIDPFDLLVSTNRHFLLASFNFESIEYEHKLGARLAKTLQSGITIHIDSGNDESYWME